MRRVLAIAAILLGAGGCALTSRGASLSVHHYAPEPPRIRAGSAEAQARGPRPALRLGRVRGAPYLHERIAYRESEYEVGFYDDREWTERPEAYVRRALARKLFEERGFEQWTVGPAPTLEVEVLAFEERRTPGLHAARIELRYRLDNEGVVVDEKTFAIERPVSGATFDDFVAAMSEALDEATDRIADAMARARAASQ